MRAFVVFVFVRIFPVTLPPWFFPWRAGRAFATPVSFANLAASVLCCAAAAQPPTPPTLSEALDAAWERSLQIGETSGQQRLAVAEQAAARSGLAAPPVLELSQREGRRHGLFPNRETDLGIVLPLWRPGHRAAAAQAADADLAWAQAQAETERLRLAGQVQDTAAAIHALTAEVDLTNLQRQWLESLSADVLRRVQAGDLAPADAMAAQAEVWSARAQDTEARQRLHAQQLTWQALTGLSLAPEPAPPNTLITLKVEETPPPTLETHPELRLATQAVERARQRLDRVQHQQGAPLELTLHVRQESFTPDGPTQQSVGVGLRLPLPLGAETLRQPRVTAALAELDVAQITEQRTRTRLSSDWALAQSQWHSHAAQAQAERERATLLRQRAGLIEISFKAGETALPDMLRALNAAAQAEVAALRQAAALDLAQARLQHALGILP
jgi:outer membrane protein TolC